jgi:hypothetical protein
MREFSCPLDILGPNIAAQPKLTGIGSSDHSLRIRHSADCGNRAKGLIIESWHTLFHIRQCGGRIESSWIFKAVPSAKNTCSLCNTMFHLAARPAWIPATVLFREIRELGYEGGLSQLKAYLAPLKVGEPEPLVRFETQPGEQMQADCPYLRRGRYRLLAFVASYSELSVTIRDITGDAIEYEAGFSVSDITAVDKIRADILRQTYYAVCLADGGFASSVASDTSGRPSGSWS